MSGEEQEQVLLDTLVAIRARGKEIAYLIAGIRAAQEAYNRAYHLLEYPAEVDEVISALTQPDEVKRWVHEVPVAEKALAELERLERDM